MVFGTTTATPGFAHGDFKASLNAALLAWVRVTCQQLQNSFPRLPLSCGLAGIGIGRALTGEGTGSFLEYRNPPITP